MSSRALVVGTAVGASVGVFFTTFYAEMARATFQTGTTVAEDESEPVPVSDPEPVEPISEPPVSGFELVPQKTGLVTKPVESISEPDNVVSLDLWRKKHAA